MKKMKIVINSLGAAGAAAAAALPVPEAHNTLASAIETCSVVKLDRDENDDSGLVKRERVEHDDVGFESKNVKRSKQEGVLSSIKKDETELSDDDAPMQVNTWLSDAHKVLDFMDKKDELRFFCGDSVPKESNISFVRSQLRSGAYESFEDFLTSLNSVYSSAQRHGGDAHKQAL